jgi:hypothetical protein
LLIAAGSVRKRQHKEEITGRELETRKNEGTEYRTPISAKIKGHQEIGAILGHDRDFLRPFVRS